MVESVSSTPGAPVEIAAVSISAFNSNLTTQELTASAITSREPNSTPNTTLHSGASEQLNQTSSWKGNTSRV